METGSRLFGAADFELFKFKKPIVENGEWVNPPRRPALRSRCILGEVYFVEKMDGDGLVVERIFESRTYPRPSRNPWKADDTGLGQMLWYIRKKEREIERGTNTKRKNIDHWGQKLCKAVVGGTQCTTCGKICSSDECYRVHYGRKHAK